MKVSIKAFIYHKTAERYSDCFDRFSVNLKTNKFAVSDGVSKSFFPGIWAQLLTNTFVNTEGKVNLSDTEILKSLQNKWVKTVEEIVNKPGQKFFVRNLFAQGRSAAATFVGLHFFKDDQKYKWEAFAIGDSFLFFVPETLKNINNNFENVVFLSSKKDFAFDNFPDFLDSRDKVSKGKIKRKHNELESGTFYVMTDALSEWFIREKQGAIQEINSWKSQQDFEERIRLLRNNSLQNDDVAILIIEIEQEEDSREIQYKDVLFTNLEDLLEIENKKFEKQEFELKEIERQLNKKYQEVIKEEEMELLVKQKEEALKAREQFLKSQDEDRVKTRNKLMKRQEEERKEFEYHLDKKEKSEKIEFEEQIGRKQELEKNELRKDIEQKLDAEKSSKYKEIIKKYEVQETSTKRSLSKNEGHASQKNDQNSGNFGDNIKGKKSEQFISAAGVSKKKGFLGKTWEATLEIGHETWDKVSNFISSDEKSADEEKEHDIVENELHANGKKVDINNFKKGEKKNEKNEEDKGSSQKPRKNDDLNSIIDKF